MSISDNLQKPFQNLKLLPLLQANIKNNGKEQYIEFGSTSASNEKITVAYQEVKKIKKTDSTHRNAPAVIDKIGKEQVVRINLECKENKKMKFYRVAIKVDDLSAALGVDKKKVTELVDEGVLYEFIRGRAQAQMIIKQEETNKSATKTPPQKEEITENLDLDARKKICMAQYDLKESDFNKIEEFYKKHDWNKYTEPVFLSRRKYNLPYSLEYVPDGPRKGLHVITKKEVGIGSFGKAKVAFHFDTGKKEVFRSANARDVGEFELEANRILSDDPKHFVVGTFVRYKGFWRPRKAIREARSANPPKSKSRNEKLRRSASY